MIANPWKPSSGRREPAELMKPVVDPAAWEVEDMARSQEWIYLLSDTENDEIERAVADVESQNLNVPQVGTAEFRLPTLAGPLADVKRELMHGRGFALLRGLRLDRMSKAQASIAFWGVGAYLGQAIPQNGKGHVLDHVKFMGGKASQDRGYTTNAELSFHCDSCDILGLGVVNTGKSGGEHRICSSVTLYNRMLAARPDLVKELGGMFYRHRSGDGYGGAKPWVVQRAFSFQDGYFTCRSAGGSILGAQRFPEVPRLTEKQKEALALFKTMADEQALVIPFRRGDAFWVMNHTMMHARTAYEDWPEPERKRHLMRLWLRNDMRPLPPEILETMGGPPLVAGAAPKAILEVA